MRTDPISFVTTDDERKDRAFNSLRTLFSRAMLLRFHEIKDNIEDIWELTENKTLLFTRLQVIASKDSADLTEDNLKDMALICCILWNGFETDTDPV